jgi:hypothetical protein
VIEGLEDTCQRALVLLSGLPAKLSRQGPHARDRSSLHPDRPSRPVQPRSAGDLQVSPDPHLDLPAADAVVRGPAEDAPR